jgi:hypothetical protein
MTALCDSASREYRDQEWLRENYVDEGLSTYELAERCGVTDTTIRDWPDRHGIDTRPANGRETRRECAIYRMHHEGYMICQSSHRLTSGRDRRQTRVRVHTLLAIAEGASPESLFGKESTHVVHHKNGIRWDNRPENIGVTRRDQHTSKHWETREPPTRDGRGHYRDGFDTPASADE